MQFQVLPEQHALVGFVDGDFLRSKNFCDYASSIISKRLETSLEHNVRYLILDLSEIGELDDGRLHKLVKENGTTLEPAPLFSDVLILLPDSGNRKLLRKIIEYNLKYLTEHHSSNINERVKIFDTDTELSQRLEYLNLKQQYILMYHQGFNVSEDPQSETNFEFNARVGAIIEILESAQCR